MTNLAIDPVCGMQVQIANAAAQANYNGGTFYFCADRCRDRFLRDPQQFVGPPLAVAGAPTNRPR